MKDKVIKKRINFPNFEIKRVIKKLYISSLKTNENKKNVIKKVDKYRIIPVNLCDIDSMEVI
tara:strand:+ start:6024 stop:6209 length:186 start_codon:yes stop_codon:yes gene_type:complete